MRYSWRLLPRRSPLGVNLRPRLLIVPGDTGGSFPASLLSSDACPPFTRAAETWRPTLERESPDPGCTTERGFRGWYCQPKRTASNVQPDAGRIRPRPQERKPTFSTGFCPDSSLFPGVRNWTRHAVVKGCENLLQRRMHSASRGPCRNARARSPRSTCLRIFCAGPGPKPLDRSGACRAACHLDRGGTCRVDPMKCSRCQGYDLTCSVCQSDEPTVDILAVRRILRERRGNQDHQQHQPCNTNTSTSRRIAPDAPTASATPDASADSSGSGFCSSSLFGSLSGFSRQS
jgi:hypothetical protein